MTRLEEIRKLVRTQASVSSPAVAHLLSLLDRATEALEFYADGSCYVHKPVGEKNHGGFVEMIEDHGDRARAALKEIRSPQAQPQSQSTAESRLEVDYPDDGLDVKDR